MKARHYLILMAVAILVPVTVIAGAGLSMLLDWERESRIRSVESNARATALLVDREVAAAQAALRVLGNSDAMRRGDFAEIHREAAAMNASTPWTWTLLIDYDGSPLMNTLVPYGTRLPGHAGPWVAQAWDSQRPHVSGYFVGALSRKPTVSVDVPAPRTAGGRWVLSQIFDAGHFATVFADKGIRPDWVVGIIDRDGVSIARNVNDTLVGTKARPELIAAARAANSGMVRHQTRDGVEVYDIFTHSDATGWTIAIGVPVAEIEKAARAATLYAGLALLALMGIAFGIASFLAQRLSVALDRARRTAEALPLGAPARPAPTRVHEVDVLQDALYHTSENLARERAARTALESEREALLQGERDARRLAEAQSAAKDNFLAMLGHELRNPLAAIAGALRVLDMPAANAQMTAHARAIGLRQTRHLTRIVDDLLDVRRILSGKVELKTAPIDAGALLLHCCATRQVVDAGMHAWTVSVPALWVDGDATRLEQVFDNLLHNAIKYTPAGGAIAVRGRAEDGVAVFEVSDTGIGIEPATLPLIFEALVQGPVSIDRAQGGLGLGLALVRELVALHGGSVTAASSGDGQGSTFTLRLPLVAAPARAADPEPDAAASAA
ncbi:ATP-binding protein [Massilia sp.]|uniref:ATP-binding protein n=1 Tax=Massilia sp. TaxID=1882437 RepID=UPI00352F5C64